MVLPEKATQDTRKKTTYADLCAGIDAQEVFYRAKSKRSEGTPNGVGKRVFQKPWQVAKTKL